MKKIISIILICVLILGIVAAGLFVFFRNDILAKKINKAAEANTPMSYEEVKDVLGKRVIDVTEDVSGERNGNLIVLNRVKNEIDFRTAVDKMENGKTVKGIVVVIENGKAVKAVAGKLNFDSLK